MRCAAQGRSGIMSAVPERQVRHLEWEGCFNVRDLGGLPTTDGGQTRWGAAVRADSLGALTSRGWEEACAHGIRTVIDLRNEDERGRDAAPRPNSVTTIRIPLDEIEDREFWADEWENGPQFGTPLYYGPHLDRFPAKNAEVIAAIANAEPGGVAFHCAGGRDRCGQVAMLVLALAGVDPEDIAADYVLSRERLRALHAARGEDDEGSTLEAFLRERGTSAAQVIVETLRSVDVGTTLAKGGLGENEIRALHRRVLVPRPNSPQGDEVKHG
jgi:protein tyrosine/serine phosphatase